MVDSFGSRDSFTDGYYRSSCLFIVFNVDRTVTEQISDFVLLTHVSLIDIWDKKRRGKQKKLRKTLPLSRKVNPPEFIFPDNLSF